LAKGEGSRHKFELKRKGPMGKRETTLESENKGTREKRERDRPDFGTQTSERQREQDSKMDGYWSHFLRNPKDEAPRPKRIANGLGGKTKGHLEMRDLERKESRHLTKNGGKGKEEKKGVNISEAGVGQAGAQEPGGESALGTRRTGEGKDRP